MDFVLRDYREAGLELHRDECVVLARPLSREHREGGREGEGIRGRKTVP